MNERIRELAEQAGVSIDGMGYGEGNIEELIKLIVAECISVVNNKGEYFNTQSNKWQMGCRINEHFGVE